MSFVSQTHRRSSQYAETQALSFYGKVSISQGTQPLPPDFLIAVRVKLHCYAGERGKRMGSSVYNAVP